MNVKSICQGLSKETQKPLLTAKNKPKQTASHILPSEIYAVCFCDLLLVLIRCSVSLPVNSHFTVSTLSVLSLSSLRISQLNLTEKKHGFSLSFFSWLYFLCCQPHCHRRDFCLYQQIFTQCCQNEPGEVKSQQEWKLHCYFYYYYVNKYIIIIIISLLLLLLL